MSLETKPYTNLIVHTLRLMSSFNFQPAENLPRGSVEFLVSLWNNGSDGAIDTDTPLCPFPYSDGPLALLLIRELGDMKQIRGKLK